MPLHKGIVHRVPTPFRLNGAAMNGLMVNGNALPLERLEALVA